MERLYERIKMAEKAISAFEEVMAMDCSDSIIRDAAIHRFEFTVEAIWKAAKQMLLDIEGMDVCSPKGVIRSCREIGMMNETETMHTLQIVDHRNLTVHTYNEALAIEIYGELKSYLALLKQWLGKIKLKLSE